MILTASCGGYSVEHMKKLCNREAHTFIIDQVIWNNFLVIRAAQPLERKVATIFPLPDGMTKQKISFYWQSWLEPERVNFKQPARDDLTLMADGKPFALMKNFSVNVQNFENSTEVRCIEATPEVYFRKATVPKWFEK